MVGGVDDIGKLDTLKYTMLGDEIVVLNCELAVADETELDDPANGERVFIPEAVEEEPELPVMNKDALFMPRDEEEVLEVPGQEGENADNRLSIPVTEEEELIVVQGVEELLETSTIKDETMVVAEDAEATLEVPAMDEEPLAAKVDEAELDTPAEDEAADSELGRAVVDVAYWLVPEGDEMELKAPAPDSEEL